MWPFRAGAGDPARLDNSCRTITQISIAGNMEWRCMSLQPDQEEVPSLAFASRIRSAAVSEFPG